MSCSDIDKESVMDKDKKKEDPRLLTPLKYKTGDIITTPRIDGGVTYSISIAEPIYEVYPYNDLLHVLITATEKDEVVIYLSSPGGSVSTGMAICNAIFNCRAMVRTVAVGIVASIAAVIWCCGKRKGMTPAATLMFHMPSGFSYGKTADIQEEAGHIQGYFKELLPMIAKDILTKEDFTEMVENRKDIFLPYHVVKRRLTSRGV